MNMLGTSSWGGRGFGLALVGALALGTGSACLVNIDQKANSGKDYRSKGAKTIELEDGEGKARDIVTYPGGDRVDWKVFEIPEGKKGVVNIRLKNKPPRPGLDVAMNVYDQWGTRVARAKPRKTGKRTKRVKFSAEAGTYYVQVYAPRRMDAGQYRLRVRFKEVKEVAQVDLVALADQIPDPPTLPAPVEPVVKTPEEIKAEEEAAAEAQRKAEEEAAAAAAAAAAAPKPTNGKIVNFQMGGGGTVIITINRGKNVGVARGWSGQVLQGGQPLSGGEFKVMRVTTNKSVGKVKLSLDVIRANRTVLLSPP